MGTVIQDRPHINQGSQPRGDRVERADLFEPYRALRTRGRSERQAAKALQVPRTTLQAWRLWHDSLALCPHVAACLQSGPSLAFFHRSGMAFHGVCVAGGAWGMRLVCLLLNLPGLHRLVAASYGAQPQVHLHVAHALGGYGQTEPPRVAQHMPHNDLPVPQDATFAGGLGLIPMDPESHFIMGEQRAQARAHPTGHALMALALAPLNCRVIQAPRDEAPGLLASVAQ